MLNASGVDAAGLGLESNIEAGATGGEAAGEGEVAEGDVTAAAEVVPAVPDAASVVPLPVAVPAADPVPEAVTATMTMRADLKMVSPDKHEPVLRKPSYASNRSDQSPRSYR